MVLAATIAWFGIGINAWYGETLGKSLEASRLLEQARACLPMSWR